MSRPLLLSAMLVLLALPAGAREAADYVADGRLPAAELQRRYDKLASRHGWIAETVHRYPGAGAPRIRAWRTRTRGPALWLVSGIHGEEPAGPNAIARNTGALARLAETGVPVVVVPLANPVAYARNWRYPNTAERDWRKGGYSVGDAEYLLPGEGGRARAAAPPGPDTAALTAFVLRLSGTYPPLLVLDLHEDELSTGGGYVYSQGRAADANPVAMEVIRLLRTAGTSIRLDGATRFGEPIVGGVVSRDAGGLPLRDGSIDELFATTSIVIRGQSTPGPSARTVLVVETPAHAGERLESRIAAHAAVINRLPALWRLNGGVR